MSWQPPTPTLSPERPRWALIDRVEIIGPSGHLTLAWDPNDADDIERARGEVDRLRAVGYSFFAVTNEADPTKGVPGRLIVERISTPVGTAIGPSEPPQPVSVVENYAAAAEPPSPPAPGKRRGRPPKGASATEPTPGGARAIATRPLRGG